MNKKRILLALLLLILFMPLWLWLAWLLTPKKSMEVAILDKTVLTEKGQEHASLSWMLNNNRFVKSSEKPYTPSNDYFGFFPKQNFNYQLKGLERLNGSQIEQLSSDADMAYITDTYGIYKNEWFSNKQNAERSGIVYGGLSDKDIDFLSLLKQKHKLIITEFNTIGSPTADHVRAKFEKLFGLHWTGWTARYFPVLDTLKDAELPHWLIDNYKREHSGHWPFHKSGIAFVNSSDKVVVLEQDNQLVDPMTYINSEVDAREALNLPDSVRYPFWFDVIVADKRINTIAAKFIIHTNKKGRSEMQRNGIPAEIPAVIYHQNNDYKFYYFSGDFCDNPVSMSSSYFKGVDFFKGLFYNSDNIENRAAFFWEFYNPMMRRILTDYYIGLHAKNE